MFSQAIPSSVFIALQLRWLFSHDERRGAGDIGCFLRSNVELFVLLYFVAHTRKIDAAVMESGDLGDL